MLEWLKLILGDNYTEEIDNQVSGEITRLYTPNADYDLLSAANKQLEQDVAARDKQIGELKKADPEKFQEEITRLQQENADNKKAYEAQLRQTRIDADVDAALVAAGARNSKAVRALLALEKAELGEDGKVKGLRDQLQALAKAEDSGFLFQQSSEQEQFAGLKGGEGFRTPAGGVDTSKMNYEQLAAYMEANPDAQI